MRRFTLILEVVVKFALHVRHFRKIEKFEKSFSLILQLSMEIFQEITNGIPVFSPTRWTGDSTLWKHRKFARGLVSITLIAPQTDKGLNNENYALTISQSMFF